MKSNVRAKRKCVVLLGSGRGFASFLRTAASSSQVTAGVGDETAG